MSRFFPPAQTDLMNPRGVGDDVPIEWVPIGDFSGLALQFKRW